VPAIPVGHTLEDEFAGIYTKHDDFTSPRLPYLWFETAPAKDADIRSVFRRTELYPQAFKTAGLAFERVWGTVLLICVYREAGEKSFRELLAGGTGFAADILRALDTNAGKTFFPYMADIVGNTICADYLDYLQRDPTNLGLDVLEVVNLRAMFDTHGPAEGSIEAPLTVLAELQRQGLVRHIGLSNVTSAQIEEGQRIAPIVCVQNQYNVAHRADDALIDDLARKGIAYVPFFPLGGFTPLQSSTLSEIAARLKATPMQVALAWLLRRAPNILLIPGTSSVAHLRENLAAAALDLPEDVVISLDGIAARAGSGHGATSR